MDSEEGVYLMHTREFIKSHEPIYKIGRSNILDNRVKQYPNGSNILLMIKCKNSILCENNLIKLFKEKFIQKKYYGTEYFEGNCYDMIKEICNYIKNIDNNIDNNNNNNNNNNVIVVEEKKVAKVAEITKEEKKIAKVAKLKEEEKVAKKVIKLKEDEKVAKKIEEQNIDKTCPKCKDKFKYKSLLKRHLETSVRCKISDQEIINIINKINKFNINKKINIKHDKNLFFCNDCNSSFIYKTSLYKHKRVSKCTKEKLKINILNNNIIN